ncbi:MAG: tocopherol cyclase family protein, partial [Anaerolineae bacterium]
WGKSFPSAWIWFQTNHFEQPGTSVTASMAIIPWVRRSFPGFIVGLWHGGVLYRFATYTGARIQHLVISDEQVDWVLRDRRYRLEMRALRSTGGLLHAPTPVNMGRRIAETLGAQVDLTLYKLDGDAPQLLLRGTGHHAGLEAVGDLSLMRDMWKAQLRD